MTVLFAGSILGQVKRGNGSYMPLAVEPDTASELVDRLAQDCVASLARQHFAPFCGQLVFGELASPVRLYPSPLASLSDERNLPTTLNIAAFVKLSQVASPPMLSRHVVLPPHTADDALPIGDPDFRMLLHETLRQEESAALVILAPGWYALLCPWVEKKKANLLLTVLRRGAFLPWVGPLAVSARSIRLDPLPDATQEA
jgi:hypothetical protein